MKKVIVLVLAILMLFALTGCDRPLSSDPIPITNEILKEMIDSGKIAKDVTELDLWAGRYFLSTLSDITPLASLTNLQVLNISSHQIIDIVPLASLTSLRELDLSGNQISDLEPLASLTNLQKLDLKGNPLTQEQIDKLQKALPDCKIVWE